MDLASLTLIALVSLFVVAATGYGNNSTQNSVNVVVDATTGRDPGNGRFHLFLHACFLHQVKRVFASWKQCKVVANTT